MRTEQHHAAGAASGRGRAPGSASSPVARHRQGPGSSPLCVVAFGAIALLGSAAVWAAQAQDAATGRLAGAAPDLPFPSIGRVVLGFLLTVGLAVGVAYLLRRWWPALSRGRTGATSIRTIDRSAVSTTLSVYLIEVEGVRFLVAEGRGGISLTHAPRQGGTALEQMK